MEGDGGPIVLQLPGILPLVAQRYLNKQKNVRMAISKGSEHLICVLYRYTLCPGSL